MFTAGIFVAFAALFLVTSRIAAGDGATPPPPGDSQDYDNIAVQLLRGRGFAIDYSDPEWRRPYREHNPEGDFDDVLKRNTPRQSARSAAPLLPVALAIVYRIFGRDFLTWRIVASLLAAAGLALICDVAWLAIAPRVALLAAGIMVLSFTYIRHIAYLGLTPEPLVIVFAAAIVWTLSRIGVSNANRMAVASGVAMALLCASWIPAIVWLPAVAILVWWLTGTPRAAALFAAVAIVLQAPAWLVALWPRMQFEAPGGYMAPAFWLAALAPFVVWRRRAFIALPIAVAMALFAVIEPLLTVFVAVTACAMLFGEDTVGRESPA